MLQHPCETGRVPYAPQNILLHAPAIIVKTWVSKIILKYNLTYMSYINKFDKFDFQQVINTMIK